MNTLTPLYVSVESFVRGRVEAAKRMQKDRGVGMIEYGALCVLVLVILGVLIHTQIGHTLSNGIKHEITAIFNGGGGPKVSGNG